VPYSNNHINVSFVNKYCRITEARYHPHARLNTASIIVTAQIDERPYRYNQITATH